MTETKKSLILLLITSNMSRSIPTKMPHVEPFGRKRKPREKHIGN
jgi:hypothetical protein